MCEDGDGVRVVMGLACVRMVKTNQLIKSIVIPFNFSALCKSARIKVSAAVSTLRLLHRLSSHINFNLSS